MIRPLLAAGALAVLTACGGNQTPQPKFTPVDGVTVTAAPVKFFRQGVVGRTSRDPAIMTGTFEFLCERSFGGRSAQARANASAAYASFAQTKTHSWMMNPRTRGSHLRSVRAQSVPQQGCTPTKLVFENVTSDKIAVAQFVLANNLLQRIAAMR